MSSPAPSSDRRVALEVVTDHEAPDDVERYARILTDLGADVAPERRRRFDEDWWLDALPTAEYALTRTIQHVSV